MNVFCEWSDDDDGHKTFSVGPRFDCWSSPKAPLGKRLARPFSVQLDWVVLVAVRGIGQVLAADQCKDSGNHKVLLVLASNLEVFLCQYQLLGEALQEK